MKMFELPFKKQEIIKIMEKHSTPFHIYDEKLIRENAKNLKKAFKDVYGFKEFFAVKACPNPFILKIFKDEGFGTDCSSLPELMLSEKVGIVKEDIMFTSNDTPEEEFIKAKKLGAIINIDDISHIDFLEKCAGMPELISFRYNPGKERKGNAIIGAPEEAKYGFTKEQLFEGYRICKEKGAKRFGIHTMVASNILDPKFFIDTANMLFDLVVEISKELDIKFEFINIGGGVGVPYKLGEKAVSYEEIAKAIKKSHEDKIIKNGLEPVKLYTEFGRAMTGPYGWLITQVRHLKHIYKDYVGTDASMANLMRPAIYGAYHHITVLGKEEKKEDHKYDVTGSLCENNDKFAIDRMLPEIEVGDILAIHTAGAHGHAMGFNYNGKLRSAELLRRQNKEIVEIRRAETVDDYFSTLDFKNLDKFKA
ncbi:MAG: diaminopimelate decarboxylase [bacterium]|nr:diaminopimelate decarboxylase [bacterium]